MMKKIFFGLIISYSWTLSQDLITVNHKRLNDHMAVLSKFGQNDIGGVSRVAYSDADLAGRVFTIQLMKKAFLQVRIDAGGNIIGYMKGKDSSLSAIAIGSHIDSVPEGGNYDGNVGSMSAIEVAHTIHENNIQLTHPLIVVIFQNEEGGLFGSKVMTTGLTEMELDLPSSSGLSIRDGIEKIGGDISKIRTAQLAKNEWAAYIELHIEQGGFLFQEGNHIGVVEGIVGIKQWDVTVNGFPNHAGTTPMDQRRDALYAASQYVQAVHEIGKHTPGRQVATVGKLQSFPGAPNVVPGLVNASLEIRDLDAKKMDFVFNLIKRKSMDIGQNTGTKFHFEPTISIVPQLTDSNIRTIINQSAQSLGLSTKEMPSGAGHDAQEMAVICPVGMIFVPSKNGISHSPTEYSSSQDITNGANVLLHTVLNLDRQLNYKNK